MDDMVCRVEMLSRHVVDILRFEPFKLDDIDGREKSTDVNMDVNPKIGGFYDFTPQNGWLKSWFQTL